MLKSWIIRVSVLSLLGMVAALCMGRGDVLANNVNPDPEKCTHGTVEKPEDKACVVEVSKTTILVGEANPITKREPGYHHEVKERCPKCSAALSYQKVEHTITGEVDVNTPGVYRIVSSKCGLLATIRVIRECWHPKKPRDSKCSFAIGGAGWTYESRGNCPICNQEIKWVRVNHKRTGGSRCETCRLFRSLTCTKGCQKLRDCKCKPNAGGGGGGGGGGGPDRTPPEEPESPPDFGPDTRLLNGDVPLFLEVGDWSASYSESWRLRVGEGTLTSNVGEVEVSSLYWFGSGGVYECSLEHMFSSFGKDNEDYDYVAFIREAIREINDDGDIVVSTEPGVRIHTDGWYGGENFVVDNTGKLFGDYDESHGVNYPDHSATLYVPKLTLTEDGDAENHEGSPEGISVVRIRLDLLLAERMKNDGLTSSDAILELSSNGNATIKDTSGQVICVAGGVSDNLWDKLTGNDLEIIAEIPCGEAYIIVGSFYVGGRLVSTDFCGNPVDLDIDSDNNNGYGMPDESLEEDTIENDEDKPGKIIQVNDDDTDGDGRPDFADDQVETSRFVPIKLQLRNWDDDNSRLRFVYDMSDPAEIKETTDDDGNTTYELPEEGKFRIWIADHTEGLLATPINEDGYLLQSDFEYNSMDLEISGETHDLVFYVEAVKPGRGTIKVYYTPDVTDKRNQEYTDEVAICGVKLEFVVPGEDYYNPENPNYDSEPVATDFIGVSSPRPTVIIENKSSTIGGGGVVVNFSGYLRDPIADNVPRGAGADIEELEILVNGNAAGTASLGNATDTKKGFWQQHYYKHPFNGTATVPLEGGTHTVRLQTGNNAAGNMGYADIIITVTQQVIPGTGGGTVGSDGTVTSYLNLYIPENLAGTATECIMYYGGDREPDLDDPADPEDSFDPVLTESENSSFIFNGLNSDNTQISVTVTKVNGAAVPEDGSVTFDPLVAETVTANISYTLADGSVMNLGEKTFTETGVDSKRFMVTVVTPASSGGTPPPHWRKYYLCSKRQLGSICTKCRNIPTLFNSNQRIAGGIRGRIYNKDS